LTSDLSFSWQGIKLKFTPRILLNADFSFTFDIGTSKMLRKYVGLLAFGRRCHIVRFCCAGFPPEPFPGWHKMSDNDRMQLALSDKSTYYEQSSDLAFYRGLGFKALGRGYYGEAIHAFKCANTVAANKEIETIYEMLRKMKNDRSDRS
jgi:hypothetical protein